MQLPKFQTLKCASKASVGRAKKHLLSFLFPKKSAAYPRSWLFYKYAGSEHSYFYCTPSFDRNGNDAISGFNPETDKLHVLNWFSAVRTRKYGDAEAREHTHMNNSSNDYWTDYPDYPRVKRALDLAYKTYDETP